MTDGGDPRKKLAYDESVRALQHQSSTLDDLRSRTGILLAALTLSATFLGGRALVGSAFSVFSWSGVALLCFLVAGGLCLAILWPSAGWSFIFDAKKILKAVEEEDTLDEMHSQYAGENRKNWEKNDKKLECLYGRFRWAVAVLILQVFFWLLAFGTSSHASTQKTQQTTNGAVQGGGKARNSLQRPSSTQ